MTAMQSIAASGTVVLALVAIPATGVGQSIPVSEDCAACHLTLEDRLAEPARLFQEKDIHAELGFGCLACHGSGGEPELRAEMGFLSKPQRSEIPAMCGRCHSDGAYMRQFNPQLRTDQVSEYWTSTHGIRLRDLGDPDVATCIDCHLVHQIRPPDDPESGVYVSNIPATCGRCHSDPEHMAGHDIATDQEEKWRGSVHGQLLEDGDLSAPVCNDCHGNHGAAPPEATSIRLICGQCHAVMADYFDASGHEEIFNDAGLPACATCHDHHAIDPVEEEVIHARAEEVCTQCHEETDAGAIAFDGIERVLDSLTTAEQEGRAMLEEAQAMGMEVSQALFELEDVVSSRTKAHNATHTFHDGPVREEAGPGLELAQHAIEHGIAAHEEHRFRRVGLAIFAGIVVLLIIGLLVKIREMDASMSTVTEGSGGS